MNKKNLFSTGMKIIYLKLILLITELILTYIN